MLKLGTEVPEISDVFLKQTAKIAPFGVGITMSNVMTLSSAEYMCKFYLLCMVITMRKR